MAGTPSIGLLSLSAVADDPRVRRQGDAFSSAGWNVIGVGLGGAVSQPPSWPIDDKTPALDWTRRLADVDIPAWQRALQRRKHQLGSLLEAQALRLSLRSAESTYWARNVRYGQLFDRASAFRPQVWLANDWNVLPIALRLAAQHRAVLVYDTHELATEEFAEKPSWRLVHRPLVVSVEREGLKRASLVTCVSGGIAERLQAIYRLSERPLVVHNTPAYQPMPFRPTAARIEVLYHGIVSPGRGLEECIQSVALWRPEFRLTLRGPAEESYRTELERRIAMCGVGDRVRLAPAVPMTELVREAACADVGLFALSGHSRHNRFALPNKFFEYAMAGLALCVSDLPEMSDLLRQYDLGRLIPGMSPEAIASQVNALDRESIDRYKRNALVAARSLNWETESRKLVARCAALITGLS